MADAMDILSDLDAALERVDKQRDAIISLHQQVMNKVSPSVEENFDSYEERQLAHAMMRNPRRPLDLDAFSNGLRIQSVHAEKMMETLRKKANERPVFYLGIFHSRGGCSWQPTMVDGEIS